MMKHLLLCGGLEGDADGLRRFRQVVDRRRPDAVVFAGGVLAPAADRTPLSAWDLSREDARFLEKFFETLGELCVFSAVIPGPHDAPLEEFLRLGMHAEVEFPGLHVVHGTLVERANAAFCGIGGRIADGPGTEPGAISRTLAEYALRPLWNTRKPRRVLVLGEPPRGPLGGDQGRAVVGDWIDSFHPSLCVVGGPTTRRGTQIVASTLVVNPGRLADGSAAWLDWQRPLSEAVEFLRLSAGEARDRAAVGARS